jgi:hypothetical protein
MQPTKRQKPLDTIALAGEVSRGSNKSEKQKAFLESYSITRNTVAKPENNGALGNYAESSSLIDFKGKKISASVWDADAKTVEKYAMQTQARKALLNAHYSKPEMERPPKAHRVCNCRRDLRPTYSGLGPNGKRRYEMSKPEVYKHADTGATFYGGTVLCGSPYACPVCASKINEIRATEIRKAVSEWVNSGGICLFITLTFSHSRFDSFENLMTLFTKKALKQFRSGKTYQDIKTDLGFKGLIRSTETTWGEANGWHPHSHEIWFVKPDLFTQDESLNVPFSKMGNSLKEFILTPIKTRLFNKWRSACVASGLEAPSYERGLNIKVAETEEELQARLAEYLTKTGLEKAPWGVDDELVRHNVKKGKEGRFTPFDFLRNQFDENYTKEQKTRFLKLFAEYVEGFKGVAKIFWSPKLKGYFKINDITDEQAAEQKTQRAKLELTIPPAIWVFVYVINDHRAELLLKVKNEGVPATKKWLKGLLQRYGDYLGERYLELPASCRYVLESVKEFRELKYQASG